MAKGKKNRLPPETASNKSGQPTKAKAPVPAKAMTAVQPSAFAKQTAMATDNTNDSTIAFQAFISDMASPSIAPAPAKAMAAVQAPVSVT
ncbi:UNVERIFIED_CONTAM: hypothetical protein Slati_4511400 [Sesamum latifolium]|uniref:Uncharacterized protein n=1 Tax=Sesamum latifolium TaxID=2727402 RepID=A0AAW2STJ3_9LAMI